MTMLARPTRDSYYETRAFVTPRPSCRCQENSECRYYYWYPIDYSPAPLYCYIYRSCQGGSDEMKVGFAIAGRHPGHYFLGEQVKLNLLY